jgi:hypothetical protein
MQQSFNLVLKEKIFFGKNETENEITYIDVPLKLAIGEKMEELTVDEKNKKLIKTIGWILILISVFVLLKNSVFPSEYSDRLTQIKISENLDPPVRTDYTIFFLQRGLEVILCLAIYLSAVFVLKFNKTSLKMLIFFLSTAIIYLVIYPLVNYYFLPIDVELYNVKDQAIVNELRKSKLIWSYIWSVLLSAFFIYTIRVLSKTEIKLLFK